MARMHSRKKGKAGSTKPLKKTVPSWVRYKDKEVEMLITKMAKEGKSPSVIGATLRDTYGIPDIKTLTGKSISKILEEHNLLPKLPADLTALMKRSIALRKHLETNKQDKTANRGLQLTESKIKRMVSYYKKTGKIEDSWKYQPEKIRLLLE